MAPHLPTPTRMLLFGKAQAKKVFVLLHAPIEAWVAYPNKVPFVAKRCKPFGVRHPSFAVTSNAKNEE
jgi:hypothetical protein